MTFSSLPSTWTSQRGLSGFLSGRIHWSIEKGFGTGRGEGEREREREREGEGDEEREGEGGALLVWLPPFAETFRRVGEGE